MNSLFGISMSAIMAALLVLVAVSAVAVGWIALRSPLMFKFGLRNIPRRRSQTMLIVLGLMISTMIVSAAFTTGDSLDYSIKRVAYDAFGTLDLTLNLRGTSPQNSPAPYVNQEFVPQLAGDLQGERRLTTLLPALRVQVPVTNDRTRLGEPNMYIMGDDPASIDRAHGLAYANGKQVTLSSLAPGDVLVNQTLAATVDARPGDTLEVYFDSQTPAALRVAGIIQDTLLGGTSGNFGPGANDPGGLVLPLAEAQKLSGHAGQINFLGASVSGTPDVAIKNAGAVRARLATALATDPRLNVLPFVSAQLNSSGSPSPRLVRADKVDALQVAETAGSVVTTIFVVLGLFSIAAGLMLVLLIFVLLATERKSEMGMARALGVQRSGLIEAFAAEGAAYAVLSGAVGAGLGILVALLGIVGGTRLVAGSSSPVYAHVSPRSFVVAYCLGLVLTFGTVLISSYRVSRLNITAAIRDLPDTLPSGREQFSRNRPWRAVLGTVIVMLAALILITALVQRHHHSALPSVYLGTILGAWGIAWLVRGLGGPWAIAWAIVALGAGAALFAVGRLSLDPFPFQLAVSLIVLGAGKLAQYLGVAPRTAYTVAGAALFVYWALPVGAVRWLSGNLGGGGPEMFFLSGAMMVVGSTLVLVHNAQMLTGIFASDRHGAARYVHAGAGLWLALALLALTRGLTQAIGDWVQLLYMLALLLGLVGVFGLVGARFTRFAPALKMAIAYPLANRFRTGMTIAMFSLIVFSLTVFSTLDANFSALFASPNAQGGWDIRGSTLSDKPIPDLRAALRQNGAPFDVSKLQVVGRRTGASPEGRNSQLRYPGTGAWQRFPINTADDEYLQGNHVKLQAIADGYANQQEVWRAVAMTPGLAVVEAGAINNTRFRDPSEFALSGITTQQTRFSPVALEMRDARTGNTGTVTIIGIVDRGVSGNAFTGMVVSQQAFASVFGTPPMPLSFIRLTPGTNAKTVAKQMRATLLTAGFQADAFSDILGKQQELQQGFNYLLQGFMGLGLFVGVAALGVIAFRSVIERRQQIGMLRALGFPRNTVALSFMLEGSFIAVLGILAGLVGATLLSRNIFDSGAFGVTDARFFIPWGNVLAFVAIAYGFSLLMLAVPSRRAAGIPVAEALRYE